MNTYQVQPGDTLSQLAQRYNVPQSSITGYSSGNPNLIRVGEQLHLPPNAANTSTANGPVYSSPPAPSMHPPHADLLSAQPSASASLTAPKQPKLVSPLPSAKGNWLDSAVKNVSNTIAPQAYAEQGPIQQPPPQRKTFAVNAHPDAVSTPGFVQGTPDWIKPIIQKAAQKNNIPTALLSALIKQESNFNPNARSGVGAQGIAQFMPDTAQGMGVDPMDPESAINGAAIYLRRSWDKFGSPELALAAYNAGGNAVNQYGGIPPYKETQDYVKNIMANAGEIHQSAAGPLHQTVNEIKKQSGKQNSPTKQVAGARTQAPQPTLPFKSPVPLDQVIGYHSMPDEDKAISKIRAARPNLSLSDQQLRQLYTKYGDRLLSEL